MPLPRAGVALALRLGDRRSVLCGPLWLSPPNPPPCLPAGDVLEGSLPHVPLHLVVEAYLCQPASIFGVKPARMSSTGVLCFGSTAVCPVLLSVASSSTITPRACMKPASPVFSRCDLITGNGSGCRETECKQSRTQRQILPRSLASPASQRCCLLAPLFLIRPQY